jgi:hypothetical protein
VHRRICVHRGIQNPVKQLIRARLLRTLVKRVHGLPQVGTNAFLDGDQEVGAEKEVEVRDVCLACRIDMRGFRDNKQVAVTGLRFRTLISVPAILHMKRVQVVSLGQRVQLRIVRVTHVVPDHRDSPVFIMASLCCGMSCDSRNS